MLEEERKFEVGTRFALPDLTGVLPPGGQVVSQPGKALRATYYDTTDLRLARAGASLRYRRGDAVPWTAKLPTEVPGTRLEISQPGPPQQIPAALRDLVTRYTRGAELVPSVVLRTSRVVHELRDRTNKLLAEVDDDTVSVMDGKMVRSRFREIEIERHAGKRQLLDAVGALLTAAGATVPAEFVAKHVRALGAVGKPDLVPPARELPPDPSAGEVVTAALRHDIDRIFAFDPLVRLRVPLPGGDTAVHQMRVGCRRLRSDLKTFRPLLAPEFVARMRSEVGWLADLLGVTRDAEVLRERLTLTAHADPVAPLDPASIAHIDAELAARYEEAMTAVEQALRTERYRQLLDQLVAAAAAPELIPARAGRPARKLLPRLAARSWHTLAYGKAGVSGPGELDPLAPDDEWHEVRIRAKRARYAIEAVAACTGPPAGELGKAVAKLQNIIGEHQDAVVASQTWLRLAGDEPDDHMLAITVGRLVERERAAVREARRRLPRAWRAASRRRLTGWLP